jgi:hypothetical protein
VKQRSADERKAVLAIVSNGWRRVLDLLVLTMDPSVVEAKNTAPVSTAGDE